MESTADQLTEINVLLVEDDPNDVELFSHHLPSNGIKFHLTNATTLSNARYLIETSVFHIAIVDLNLSDAQGLDIVLSLHSLKPEIPIIVLTGVVDQKLQLQCLQAGAQDILEKGVKSVKPMQNILLVAIQRQRFRTKLVKDQLERDQIQEIKILPLDAKMMQDHVVATFTGIVFIVVFVVSSLFFLFNHQG